MPAGFTSSTKPRVSQRKLARRHYTGQLFTVGSLGVPTAGTVSFDIVPFSNAGLLTVTAPGATSSQLYSVNLTTGAATLIGAVNLSEQITALSVSDPTGIAPGTTTAGADSCLQDDRNGDILQFNSCTGDYQFIRCGTGGFTLTGRATVSRGQGALILRDNRLNATFRTGFAGRNSGDAVIKVTPLGPTFLIEDNGTANNTCVCRATQ